jgi:hypothetical protein
MEINQRGEVAVGVEGGVEVEVEKKFCVSYYRHWSRGVPTNIR